MSRLSMDSSWSSRPLCILQLHAADFSTQGGHLRRGFHTNLGEKGLLVVLYSHYANSLLGF